MSRHIRSVARMLVVAVALNYVWEMVQSILFQPMGTPIDGIWRCFIASLGDGGLVLIIGFAGWVVFRRENWFARPGVAGYAFIAAMGVTLAVMVERYALEQGRWAYTDQMPAIPLLGVGLVPVLQMAALPPVIFHVTAAWLRRAESHEPRER